MSKLLLPRVDRRTFLNTGLVSTLGLALSSFSGNLGAALPAKRARACILIWLNGGPSHIDTFDPKPGAPTGGPFKAIATKVPGVHLSEHFPKLAQQTHRLAVLRSLTSREGDHEQAQYFLHTGNARSETVEHPALGSVLRHAWSAEERDLPAFVAINGTVPGPGFLGVDFAPLQISNLESPLDNLQPPEEVSEEREKRRLKALAALNRGFALRASPSLVEGYNKLTSKALALRKSPGLKAFDLSEEKAALRSAYGIPEKEPTGGEENPVFGRACLVARRLIERDVRFVEVTLDGWDTHENNFEQVEKLAGQLDRGLAALVDDLAGRGLLESTLVLCLGEFGRTPKINPQRGRDHWPDAFSVVLAGGGVRGGQVLGATDERGEHITENPVTVPDLFATLLTVFGLRPDRTYHTPDGRPIKLADKGKVVGGLLGG
jgi:hypothetical protein